jgi:hypothetical protein
VPKSIAYADDRASRRRVKDEDVEQNWLVALLTRRPFDTLGILLALAATTAISVNALYMQRGRHPSPMFAPAVPFVSTPASSMPNPMPKPRPAEAAAKAAEPAKATALTPAMTSPKPIAGTNSVVRNDPVGDLITSSRRIGAVQKVLADFGYSQLRITGVMNADTKAAIQKFERERKMPVTGDVSDRLVRELGVLAGRPIE